MPLDLVLVNCVLRSHDGTIQQSGQLGLLYIATLARDHGFHVKILAGDDVTAELSFAAKASSVPPLVGFYVNSDNLLEVLRIGRNLKRMAPHLHIILGGPLANAIDLQLAGESCVDFVCRGDGEYLVLELLHHLSTGSPAASEIRGLTYKDATG